MDTCPWRPVVFVLMVICFFCSFDAQPFDYHSANVSTVWTNNPSITKEFLFTDNSRIKTILPRGSFGPGFACGFFCKGTCESFLFSIFIVPDNRSVPIPSRFSTIPQVVWSANPNNPVRENATLHLTQEGDLVLHNVDGSVTWSTNTFGKSVSRLSILPTGNLVLLGKNNSIVWQSFDHPTDTLLPGQKLIAGQRPTASVSDSNWTQGLLYLTVTAEGLFAFAGSNPPQAYRRYRFIGARKNREPSYVIFKNGSLALYILSAETSKPAGKFDVPLASSIQYMRLEPDGHLRVYEWRGWWKEVADLLTGHLDECDYPTVCGNFGICSNGQCSCPGENDANVGHFLRVNARQPTLGCYETTPLSCQITRSHHLLAIEDISYFSYRDCNSSDLKGTDVESCKQACLKNCSCKAALFWCRGNISEASCCLLSQLFSLVNNSKENMLYKFSVFIKVQIASPLASPNPTTSEEGTLQAPSKKTSRIADVVGSVLGALFGVFLIISICFVLLRKRNVAKEEDDCFDQIPGTPTRFSYEELRVATENFCTKLGQGGFGSVFLGTLDDGTRVAVKRLENMGKGKKQLLAEVKTIGSIHHLNMVRLVGFCAEKPFRLLVYEYICNGSLDKWIFHKNMSALDWKTRRNIIIDIAKGLSYLHEECRQRIVHLDIKPQNILLDENFNAKISDFGLSELIDRDQSQVMTQMRGTRGYLAPEWLSSRITEKVDVYSFGIVVLEIVSGRKNLDYSNPEESVHLLYLVKRNAEDDRLHCIVDKHSEDMQLHLEEVVKMIKLGVWCLQSDFTRRSSMSVVVKVLEGALDMESILDYSFLTLSPAIAHTPANLGISAPPVASILSGAR